jgi:carbon starvation protein
MGNGATPVLLLVAGVLVLVAVMAGAGLSNTLIAIVVGGLVIWGGYKFYATQIDRKVIQSDANRRTPANLYMDGVDFVPTNRNVLFGYHFKGVAAAGPVVGTITAALLWGWVPALLWLALGVIFIGWASDYSAIVVSVRNEGNSMSATAHRLISPRTRQLLLLFIFFYLLLVVAAFTNITTGVVVNPTVPLGIIALAVMGVLAGQMLYRWRQDLIVTTGITFGITLLAVLLGADANGPVANFFKSFNAGLDSITGGQAVVTTLDPTRPAGQQEVRIMPHFIFWLAGVFLFSYLGSALPIWRFAQPTTYLGFWLTASAMIVGFLGAAIAGALLLVGNPAFATLAAFKLAPFTGYMAPVAAGIQPLWPMLFVTIACGAISGWHALFGSVGTARQIDNERDMLPVGGGAMFAEFALALLSLLAVTAATQQGAGAARFAAGVGGFFSVFGIPAAYGTAIASAVFVVIVICTTQLIFRVMRVTVSEGIGDAMPAFRNVHVSTLFCMLLTFLLVITGTFIYLFQLFGASNQLMAALSLLIVAVWLASTGRNPAFAAIPFLFMYVTTIAASLVTAYNLWDTILSKNPAPIAIFGSGLMIVIALLLVVAALVIGLDGLRAYQRYRQRPGEAVPSPAGT